MKPQGFTERHKSLRDFLINTAKVEPENFRLEPTECDIKADIAEIEDFNLLGDPLVDGLLPLPIDQQLRSTNEYTINLFIKNFAGDVSILFGQLMCWLHGEKAAQKLAFDSTVYWNNDLSVNLDIALDCYEYSVGTAQDGFKTL